MTLLEVITNASNHQNLTPKSQYPIIFNSDYILPTLQPKSPNPISPSPITTLQGWHLSPTDTQIIELSTKFCKKLKRMLKHLKSFRQDEFLRVFISFLEQNCAAIGLSGFLDPSNPNYLFILIEKVGFVITREAAGLVLEACLGLHHWQLLETLIAQKVVDHLCMLDLIKCLIVKKRSDLICLCIKNFSEVRGEDVRAILKYFLSTPKEGLLTMVNVRKEWESQGFFAIEKAGSDKLAPDQIYLAEQAAILLMVAYDGFTSSELCMHYLFASSNVDELMLSNAISRLDGAEMLRLIRYFGKWVRKYERFPQARPVVGAVAALGLTVCEWVPSLEAVVKCVGVVLDERFSSLVLSPEFHEELRGLEEAVKSLAAQAKFCCLVSDVLENVNRG